jgi:hypothetical protein
MAPIHQLNTKYDAKPEGSAGVMAIGAMIYIMNFHASRRPAEVVPVV